MNKRAQITIFILVGIIILLSFILLFYIKSQGIAKEEITEGIDITPIKLFVESCTKNIAPSGFYLIGLQGGYYYLPLQYLKTDYSGIGYAYYEGHDTLLTLEELEAQFAIYMKDALADCTNDFLIFKGYNISQEKAKTDLIFKEKSTIVRVSYPLTIKKDDSIVKISDFTAEFPIRLKHIYDITKTIVTKEIADPDWIDSSYLLSLDVNVSVSAYNNKTVIYKIVDEESKINDVPYIFLFANKFK